MLGTPWEIRLKMRRSGDGGSCGLDHGVDECLKSNAVVWEEGDALRAARGEQRVPSVALVGNSPAEDKRASPALLAGVKNCLAKG